MSKLNFNSIKVRLEQEIAMEKKCSSNHFNSIKVRLERVLPFALAVATPFQFHKGTIRTECCPRRWPTNTISIP